MPQYTTLAIGEEDPTTRPKWEEDVYTTLAVGEEGPVYTTMAVGEEDGGELADADNPFGSF